MTNNNNNKSIISIICYFYNQYRNMNRNGIGFQFISNISTIMKELYCDYYWNNHEIFIST